MKSLGLVLYAGVASAALFGAAAIIGLLTIYNVVLGNEFAAPAVQAQSGSAI